MKMSGFYNPQAGSMRGIDKQSGDVSFGLWGKHLEMLQERPQNFSLLMIALDNEIHRFFGVDGLGRKLDRGLIGPHVYDTTPGIAGTEYPASSVSGLSGLALRRNQSLDIEPLES